MPNMFDTRLSKRKNIAHQTREQKQCFTFLIECLMAFKFYQTRPNTTKHYQTRSNSTKQGAQTVKCLVTKQCLMVFSCQKFIVCPGPNSTFKGAIIKRILMISLVNISVLVIRQGTHRGHHFVGSKEKKTQAHL